MVNAHRIAITDIETTGLDWFKHEIIEIGLVLIDAQQHILETWSTKVRPEHIGTADSEALAVNGYNPELWHNAVPLAEAIHSYIAKTQGAMFCSHNPTFDWGFLTHAFNGLGATPTFDRHKIDIFSIAWHAFKNNPPKSFHLKDIALHLGIRPEAQPHRAIGGAMLAYEVYKKLMKIE